MACRHAVDRSTLPVYHTFIAGRVLSQSVWGSTPMRVCFAIVSVILVSFFGAVLDTNPVAAQFSPGERARPQGPIVRPTPRPPVPNRPGRTVMPDGTIRSTQPHLCARVGCSPRQQQQQDAAQLPYRTEPSPQTRGNWSYVRPQGTGPSADFPSGWSSPRAERRPPPEPDDDIISFCANARRLGGQDLPLRRRIPTREGEPAETYVPPGTCGLTFLGRFGRSFDRTRWVEVEYDGDVYWASLHYLIEE